MIHLQLLPPSIFDKYDRYIHGEPVGQSPIRDNISISLRSRVRRIRRFASSFYRLRDDPIRLGSLRRPLLTILFRHPPAVSANHCHARPLRGFGRDSSLFVAIVQQPTIIFYVFPVVRADGDANWSVHLVRRCSTSVPESKRLRPINGGNGRRNDTSSLFRC